MGATTDSDWQHFRSQMPVCQLWAYFDHAAVAALPEPARAAIEAWAADTAENGDANWVQWSKRIADVRRLAADLIGSRADEVALVRNTTEGISLVAEGYPWRPGDNVVTCAAEFPSNLYPWMNLASRGVETRLLESKTGEIDLTRLEALCDARTRIVALSWVGFATGYRVDLDELCDLVHRRGALLMLDAIQGLGVFPLDVRRTPVDFLAADGHKWLLGPEGAGVFFLRAEHLDLLRPLGIGWNSVMHAGDFSKTELAIKPSASRYEGGTFPVPSFVGLHESLKLLAAHTTDEISRRVLAITDRACERLAEAGATIISDRTPDRASGIVAFELPGRDPIEFRHRCLAERIVLSCRNGRLRISPHVYNNEDDLQRLVGLMT